MRFVVHHQSVYRYDVPVRLAPHLVRLTPRPGCGELRTHQVQVSPRPVQEQIVDDAHGNRVRQLEFAGDCQELRVDSHFELLTHPPAALPTALAPLRASTWSESAAAIDPSVRQFAADLCAQAGPDPVAFLDLLAHTLYSTCERHVRTEGDAHPAAHTLATRRGACRDLTVLFMEAARAVGLRSRFVSGYQAQAETVDGQRYLHAWPEVWLDGAGFVGWDPTHGLRVGEGHVPLCAAPAQAETMPVEGGFYFDGPSVRSTLDFSLRIATGPHQPP